MFLTSCVEIIEDLKINADGSGTFKYIINLSSSKTKVKTYLALDSLDGKKVLKQSEIHAKISNIKLTIKNQTGISKVIISEDYENYIVKLELDFDNVENLENALKMVFKEFYPENSYDHDWISYTNKTLIRNIPTFQNEYLLTYTSNDLDQGTYASIVRFPTKIESCTSDIAIKSKSGTAIMIKVPADLLIDNPLLLTNTIKIQK
jgi:hypothetical protein